MMCISFLLYLQARDPVNLAPTCLSSILSQKNIFGKKKNIFGKKNKTLHVNYSGLK